jgi:hypothetical protein
MEVELQEPDWVEYSPFTSLLAAGSSCLGDMVRKLRDFIFDLSGGLLERSAGFREFIPSPV